MSVKVFAGISPEIKNRVRDQDRKVFKKEDKEKEID